MFAEQVQTTANAVVYGAVFAIVLSLLTALLAFGGLLGSHLGPTARVIMSRLMGMILAAIAVDMLTTGLGNVLPGLAGG